MLQYILLILLPYCLATGQLGQWHDASYRFNNCNVTEIEPQPYVECVTAYVSTRPLSITFEYRFGVRDCNPCCAVVPVGVQNKLISSHPTLVNNIVLPDRFCPGYYANITTFNLTWTRSSNIPLSAYRLKWQLGSKVADTLSVLDDLDSLTVTAHKPREYTVNFGEACNEAPYEFLACTNPCHADGSNVAIAAHPRVTQRRYAVSPIATCGWRDWKNTSVVLIGGGSGLGLSMYKDLKQVGAKVLVGGRYTGKRERSLGAYSEIDPEDIIGHNMDVSKPEQIRKAWDKVIRHLPLPLVVIYNAGVAAFGPSNFMRKETLQQVIDVNALGMLEVYRLFAEQTAGDGNRSRLQITVSNSGIQDTPDLAAYTMSKRFQSAIVQSWVNDRINRQLADRDNYGQVTAIFPGPMKTDWAYDDYFGVTDLNYNAQQVDTPRNSSAEGTHNSPLVPAAFHVSSSVIDLLSLPNSIIDVLNSSLVVPYGRSTHPDSDFIHGLLVQTEEDTINAGVMMTVEEETRFIRSTFAGAYADFVYGKNEYAVGQL